MKYHTLFLFEKLGKMPHNLSSAAVVIGALRVYMKPVKFAQIHILYISCNHFSKIELL